MTEPQTQAITLDVDGLLEAAAKLIERAVAKLDISFTKCGDCGNKHYTNFPQRQVYQKIADLPTRLRHAAVHFKTGKEPDLSSVRDSTAEALGIRNPRRRR